MEDNMADNRFSRQTLLPEVGLSGQQKLRDARVFILGAGGLASSAAYYLAAAGVGWIGIADDDRVDITNLNRQILHDFSRIGMRKVDSAKQTLQGLNPDLAVETYPQRLASSEDIITAAAGYDLVIDCTDHYAVRDHLNTACLQTGTPWIHGAVSGFMGQAMTIIPGKGPCYRCLYPKTPADTNAIDPVMGVSPGIIGTIQAAEAIKWLLAIGTPLLGKLLLVDLLDMRISEFHIARNPNCTTCGKGEDGVT